ncbi:MAG: hypothetical protein FWE24_06545 [Defluviitaleaceae bacterium]|nr:hypothetical protein [Defluviitaleaceae bacterium]
MEKTSSLPITKAFIYVGIILGAGFASGAEIRAYFVEFGIGGFFGLVLACALFSLGGWAIWHICAVKGINDYKSFMDITMGVHLAKIMEAVLGLFMFIIFAAMLAATGAALNESFGLNYLLSVCIVAVVCFFTFLFGMSGIIKLNAYISPILIAGCIFIGILTFVMRVEPVFAVAERSADLLRANWYISAVTYVGYNIIGAVVILPSLVQSSKEKTLKPSLLSGVILLALGFSLYLSLSANLVLIENTQIPMLALAISHGTIITYIFMLLFLAACFTTAATNGYAVAETINGRYGVNKILLKILICILGILAALMGFSNFVRVIYPLFAIAGLIEIILIIKYFIALKLKM